VIITRFLDRIINLQMEGSAGNPGPSTSKSTNQSTRKLPDMYFTDTEYSVRNLEVVSYNK
jgi:hypothetical protein